MNPIFIFNAIAIIVILFIIWWFWIAKSKSVKAENQIDIEVKNGTYTPNRIEVSSKQSINLQFIRKDKTACSEYVIFEKLEVSRRLPINTPETIHFENLKPGKYRFTCQMGMYEGELVVKNY